MCVHVCVLCVCVSSSIQTAHSLSVAIELGPEDVQKRRGQCVPTRQQQYSHNMRCTQLRRQSHRECGCGRRRYGVKFTIYGVTIATTTVKMPSPSNRDDFWASVIRGARMAFKNHVTAMIRGDMVWMGIKVVDQTPYCPKKISLSVLIAR